MPKQEVHQLHPLGWENDPEEERFKFSTLDYLTACTFSNYGLFFKLDNADTTKIAAILKKGLERTLSQARHLCGTIEKDPGGGHSFVKRKESTVRFFVQWLDSTKYPSFDDIEKSHFCTTSLGDLNIWSVAPMTYGEKAEANPDNSPVTAAFKANFIRGGLVLNMHHHHYANDLIGWAGFTHQLAENCRAELTNTPFPPWNPGLLDRSPLTKAEVPEELKIHGPPRPERHPDHQVAITLLFHLPKSKAAELKALATPTDGSWISTYDAFSAFIWRTISRLREPVFNPDPAAPLFWAEAVDMRRRFHTPKYHTRAQGNVMFAALSSTAPVPNQPTAQEVITDWPLSRIAQYIRQLTNSVTQESLDQTLEAVAPIRDKPALNIRIDSHPPMSILQTDHRDANVTAADFGFGKPSTYRHLSDRVTEGVVIVYPPRAGTGTGNVDEGCEIAVSYERRLVGGLVGDAEWRGFFEYRGVEAVDAGDLGEGQSGESSRCSVC